jgi:solute carrier family 25 (peroxisomal adenine nucleotide transporter), member 17
MTTLLSLNPSLTMALFQLFRRLISVVHSPTKNEVLGSSSNTANKIAPTTKAARADPTPGEAFLGAAISNSIGL